MPINEPDEVTKQEASFAEIGAPGLKRAGGVIVEEFLPALKGKKAIDTFTEMHQNDPIVGAVVLVIRNLVRQSTWSIEPASDDNRDLEVAEFIETCMHDMEQSWNQFISEVLSMIVYGWSFFEIVYKRRNGDRFDPIRGSQFDDRKIGWQNLAIRSQESLFEWVYNDAGHLAGMAQTPAPDYRKRIIPFKKGLLFRTTSFKNNPEGESILRKAYRPWFFKKRIEEFEGIGVERDLAGIPKVTAPQRLFDPDANEADKQTLARLKELVKNLRNDQQAGILMPAVYDERGNKLFEVELMSSRSRRNVNTDKIIMRYNRTIAMSALADFIILGHDNVGSFALASSKTKVFSVAVGSYMDEIAEVINRHAIPRLLEVNGMTDVDFPKLVHSDIETIDLDLLAKYITAMSKIDQGMTGMNMLNYLRDQAGMPPIDPDEFEEMEEQQEEATMSVPPEAQEIDDEIE